MAQALNFPQEYAAVFLDAVKNGYTQYLRSSAFCDQYTDYYYFAGCKWKVNCNDVFCESIEIVGGKLDREALTLAVLKGKIESSEE